MLSSYSIGVHFSKNHVFIACLEKTFSRIRIKDHARIDLLDDNSDPQQMEDVEAYLTAFIESKNLGSPPVYFSLPPELSIIRRLTLPATVKEDLSSTIQYSLETYIPIKPEDLFYDSVVLSEQKGKNTIQVLLGAAKKKDIKPFLDLSVSMEKGISGVQIYSASIATYMLNQPDLNLSESAEAYVFLFDAGMLDIICFKYGNFEFSRQLPLDGVAPVEMVRDSLKTSMDRPGMEQSPITVVLCGNGFDDQDRLTMNQDPRINLKSHDIGNMGLPSEDFIPAAGVAMSGLSPKRDIQINLLPEHKRKKASITGVYVMLGLIIASLVLGLSWGFSYMIHRNMLLQNIDAELVRLEKDVREIKQEEEEITALEKKIRTVNQLNIEKVKINSILNELSRTLPSGTWIKSFSYNTGKGIKISGESEAASDLIPLLEESDSLMNCVFLSAITKDKDGKEHFLLGCDVKDSVRDNIKK